MFFQFKVGQMLRFENLQDALSHDEDIYSTF